MDPISAPGGFLGGFVLEGILLPVVASFVLDGIVLWFRGRSPRVLLIATSLTLVILALNAVAWQNGVGGLSDSQLAISANMTGAVGLILLISVPAALLGFGVRMMDLFLNPNTRELDRQAIVIRRERLHERRRLHRAKARERESHATA